MKKHNTFFTCFLIFAIPTVLFSQSIENEIYRILDESANKNGKNLNEQEIIKELENYLLIYPNSVQEDEALFRLAQFKEQKNYISEQLYLLIKLRFLHGASPLIPATMNIIDSLFTYNVSLFASNENDLAIKELKNINKAENYQQAYIEFLSYIHFSNIKDFHPFYLDEIVKYKTLYRQPDHNLDAVTYWQAETFRRIGKIESAIIHYKTVINIYNSSEFAVPAILELARLYMTRNEKEESAKYLIELVNQFPENQLTGDAQFELAQLYEYQFKDLNEAYTNYQILVESFPANNHYIQSLFKTGDLSVTLNEPQRAIESYKLVVESCKEPEEILKAYKNILKVQLEILEDYYEAAHSHVLIAQSFPKQPEAPFHLFSAIQLYSTKLNMTTESDKLLEILIKQYKGSKEAEQAKKLLHKN